MQQSDLDAPPGQLGQHLKDTPRTTPTGGDMHVLDIRRCNEQAMPAALENLGQDALKMLAIENQPNHGRIYRQKTGRSASTASVMCESRKRIGVKQQAGQTIVLSDIRHYSKHTGVLASATHVQAICYHFSHEVTWR